MRTRASTKSDTVESEPPTPSKKLAPQNSEEADDGGKKSTPRPSPEQSTPTSQLPEFDEGEDEESAKRDRAPNWLMGETEALFTPLIPHREELKGNKSGPEQIQILNGALSEYRSICCLNADTG